jgi:hypothetical protein
MLAKLLLPPAQQCFDLTIPPIRLSPLGHEVKAGGARDLCGIPSLSRSHQIYLNEPICFDL